MKKLLVYLLMLMPLAHGELGPSDAALAYLGRIAADDFELEKDTAMAEGTTREKRAAIRTSTERLADQVDHAELRAIAEKVDGKLAAVLVSCIVDYDPDQVQVHAVALLKRSGQWLPGPMLESFENTGITYLPELSESAKALELWMLRERTLQLARIRRNVQADLLADVRKAREIGELRENAPSTIVEHFIDACRAGSQPAVLAYLGGLEETLPRDWNDILRFVSKNMRDSMDASEAWKTLVAQSGARVVIETEIHGDGATVSIGEFSPFRNRRSPLAILHFPLTQNDHGLWRVKLPSWLVEDTPPKAPDPIDLALVEKFPSRLVEEHPPMEFKDPTTLIESFQEAISGPSFDALLPYMAPSEDPMTSIEQAALLWREFRNRTDEIPLLLAVHQEGSDACALFSMFDARNPRIRSTLIEPVFASNRNGLWAINTSTRQPTAETHPELMAWMEKMNRQDEAEWLKKLGLTPFLKEVPTDSAPTKAEARIAAEAWLAAIHSNDPRAILRTVAAIDDDRGASKLLRAIGHELQANKETVVLEIHRNGRWAAVSTRTVTTQRTEESYSMLYPIVSTPLGPRVLAEAALFHADTRSREFLNSAIWNRLADRLPETATDELKQIEKAHAAIAEAP